MPDGSPWVTGPTRVEAIDDVAALSVAKTSCAVRTDGSLWCWGANQFGQLGVGHASMHQSEPTRVDGLIDVAVVHTGETTCALLQDGTLWCWGHGVATGDGAPQHRSRPVKVTALLDGGHSVVDVCVARRRACATRTDCSVWCWGRGALGALGNGSLGEGATADEPMFQ